MYTFSTYMHCFHMVVLWLRSHDGHKHHFGAKSLVVARQQIEGGLAVENEHEDLESGVDLVSVQIKDEGVCPAGGSRLCGSVVLAVEIAKGLALEEESPELAVCGVDAQGRVSLVPIGHIHIFAGKNTWITFTCVDVPFHST